MTIICLEEHTVDTDIARASHLAQRRAGSIRQIGYGRLSGCLSEAGQD
jgi:hypothetical protein